MLLVFIGGGLGSLLRYGINVWMPCKFPYATITANLLGCLLIGFLFGLFQKEMMQHMHWLIFAVGFCGGFTTFSSFALENFKFLVENDWTNFVIYTLGSLILGLIMVYLGFWLSTKI